MTRKSIRPMGTPKTKQWDDIPQEQIEEYENKRREMSQDVINSLMGKDTPKQKKEIYRKTVLFDKDIQPLIEERAKQMGYSTTAYIRMVVLKDLGIIEE